jgi:hypothetical protein
LFDPGHSGQPLNLTLAFDNRESPPGRLGLAVGFDQQSETRRVDELKLAQIDDQQISCIGEGSVKLLLERRRRRKIELATDDDHRRPIRTSDLYLKAALHHLGA